MDYKILLRSSKLLQIVMLYKTDSTQFLEKKKFMHFSQGKLFLKCIQTLKGSRITKAILKKNTAGGPPS